MLAESGPGSRQSTVLRFCITIVCVLVIIVTAGHYFIKVIESAKKTEAQTAVASFSNAIAQVHRNWLLQGKTSQVKLTSLNEQGKLSDSWIFVVNSEGWPINIIKGRVEGSDKPNCSALWYALQKNERLDYSGQAIRMMVDEFGRLTEIKKISFASREQIIWVCQSLVAQHLLFRYRLDTGKVELLQ